MGERALKLTDKRFGTTYDFTGEGQICEVEDAHANVLMRENPRAFMLVSRTGTLLTGNEVPLLVEDEEAEAEVEIDGGPGIEGSDNKPEELKIKV